MENNKTSCHNCGEIIDEGQYFCSVECRTEFNTNIDDGN